MDAEEILAATGGLPPSAFSLPSRPTYQGVSSSLLPIQSSSIIAGPLPSNETFSKWKQVLTEHNFWSDLPIASPGAPEIDLDGPLAWENISHEATAQDLYEHLLKRRYDASPSDQIRETPTQNTRTPLKLKQSEQVKALTQAANGTVTSQAKKRRNWFSATVKRVLDSQFLNNPYPANSRIAELAAETNLKEKQVKNWFTNRRSRSSPQGLSIFSFSSFASNFEPMGYTYPNAYFQGLISQSLCLSVFKCR
jgi:hypothetical protein